jgi:apolipoprotein N-acyltransferase
MSTRWSRIIAGLLSLVFIYASYSLIDRHSRQELWGHLPLFQFASFWLLLVLAVKCKSVKNPAFLHSFGLASLTAVLLSLAFPPFPFPFLLFIAFVPLLSVLKPWQEKDRISWRKVFFLLYHTFLLWNILTTYWVANTAYLAGIFANTVNALLMTLPVITWLFIVRVLGRKAGLVAFAVTWLTFEFLHMRWELYWPWLTLGNGLAKMPFGIQWYSFTGTLGGSLWILVTNYLIFEGLQYHDSVKKWRRYIHTAVWVLVPLIFSSVVYWQYEDKGPVIEVVSVQPNFEPHYEKFTFPQEVMVDRCLSLAGEKITSQTDFVVLPETSFSRVNLDVPWHSPAIQRLGTFAEHSNLLMVTGLAAFRYLENQDEHELPTTIPLNRSDGTTEYAEQYNCAVQIDPGGSIQEYYKALYVPGAEFFPFKRILFFLQPIVDQLGGTNYGYRIRSKFNLFSSDKAIVAPAICYESIFGEFMTRFVQKGAQVIFVMTNDGWWDNTAGHRQHADYARLRAIECRRSVIRSANMGTCCIINQRGDMSQKTEYGVPGAINVKARKNTGLTFYARWGDVIGRLSLFLALLFTARAAVQKVRGSL